MSRTIRVEGPLRQVQVRTVKVANLRRQLIEDRVIENRAFEPMPQTKQPAIVSRWNAVLERRNTFKQG